jgi:putative membrane protein
LEALEDGVADGSAGSPGWLRACLGGALMGLANLVPGISGGTMLLAAGVYTAFVDAIAQLSTLRIRLAPIQVIGAIAGTAALAILLLAGPTRTLVVEQRWIMYSLFIGLTLGGVPIVWRMARPPAAGFFVGSALAFAVMVWMAFSSPPGSQAAGSTATLFLAGIAGASAMILPGVSGGYLLLLLGQYVPILGAVDQLKHALLGLRQGALDTGLLVEALAVVIPVGVGVLIGVVAVSNAIRWLLARYSGPTLGVLMGLLLGAVVGLWPFQEGVPPRAGDVIKGQVVSEATLASIRPEDWNVARFPPTGAQVAAAIALSLAGYACTRLLDRVGSVDAG